MTSSPQLRPLAPDDAIRAFAQAHAGGIGDRALRRAAELGAVFRWGGRPVVASVWRDELVREDELYVAYAPPDVRTSPDAMHALATAFRADGCRVSGVSLRLPPLDRPRPEPFRLDRIYLTKRVRHEPLDVRDDVAIRPPTGGEVAAVHRLLAEGFVQGYGLGGRSVAPDAALRYVEDRFGDFASDAVRALVAVAGGRVVGHATWFPRVVDDLSGEEMTEIVDVSVLPGYRGQGVSDLLARAVEQALPDSTVMLGRLTCDDAGAYLGILRHLTAAGWSPAYELWTLRLG